MLEVDDSDGESVKVLIVLCLTYLTCLSLHCEIFFGSSRARAGRPPQPKVLVLSRPRMPILTATRKRAMTVPALMIVNLPHTLVMIAKRWMGRRLADS